MAIFPRPSTPRAFLSDLKAFFGQQDRHKLLIAVISALMPMIIIWGFYLDSRTDKPKVQVIFVQSWPSNRTDAEIEKQNIADQKVRDAERKKKQEEYRRLADKLGIDY